MPSPGKEYRFRHDSASHGKCDSPPGIPLRPRQHGAGPAPCPSAATPFAGGSCPCPPGTHRYRASISGSIWKSLYQIFCPCQQADQILENVAEQLGRMGPVLWQFVCPPAGCSGGRAWGCGQARRPAVRRREIWTTTPVRANRAMALGMTMRLLNISVSSHTRSLEARVPRKMNTRARTE